MRAALVPVLLLLVLSAAPVEAHIGPFSQNQSLPLGPYAAYIQLQPQDLYSNNSVSFSALITNNTTGNYVLDVSATMSMTGPGGWNKSVDLQHDPTSYLVATLVLGPPGNYSATFTVHGTDGHDYSQSTKFIVYPDLGVRIASADPNLDIITGRRTQVAIEIDDPVDSHRIDKLTDLKMSIEHWSTDHTVLYDTTVVTMQHAGQGLWTDSYSFPTQGMYHLRFASESGGFSYPDIPILHLYVTDPVAATGGGSHKVPAPPLVAFVGVAALAALLARRR